jgi:glucokinase
LAIFSTQSGDLELVRRKTYASAEHDCLKELLAEFLHEERQDIDAACLGLPAPIHSGVVFPLTNLPWQVDKEALFRAIGTQRVALINDVEASAAGMPDLSPEDMLCLQPGHRDVQGNRALISVGTGLGVSAVTPSGHAFATESGHASFAPSCDFDYRFHAALKLEYGHVSWERVASGSALPRIHAFLAGDGAARFEGSEIVRRSRFDSVCRQALETFRRYVGSAAGNIALTLMASGGLYIGGGAAESVLDRENADPFIEAFRGKGRMDPLLAKVPVFVVGEVDLALRGAARRAIALFEASEQNS